MNENFTRIALLNPEIQSYLSQLNALTLFLHEFVPKITDLSTLPALPLLKRTLTEISNLLTQIYEPKSAYVPKLILPVNKNTKIELPIQQYKKQYAQISQTSVPKLISLIDENNDINLTKIVIVTTGKLNSDDHWHILQTLYDEIAIPIEFQHHTK